MLEIYRCMLVFLNVSLNLLSDLKLCMGEYVLVEVCIVNWWVWVCGLVIVVLGLLLIGFVVYLVLV